MESRYLQNLNISLKNIENVQVGNNNILLVVRAIEEDKPENKNNISQSEVTLRSGVDKELNYKVSGPACINIGDHCTVAEVILNKEFVKDLKTGKFTITTGDNLVSVTWYNNQSQSEQVEADRGALKIKFSDDQNITELEKQVFQLLADCKDTKLVQLITELLDKHQARLKHINMGCIELEFDLEPGAANLQDKKEEIKDLLRRTIIPEGAKFDIELQSPSLKANEGLPTPESLEYKVKDNVMIDDGDRRSVVAGASSSYNQTKTLSSEDGEVDIELQFQNLTTQDTKPVAETTIPIDTFKDKKTGDLMDDSLEPNIVPSDIPSITDSLTPVFDDPDTFILQIEQCLNDCLEEVAIFCQNVIQRELEEYSSGRAIRDRKKVRSKINTHIIKEIIGIEFKQLCIKLCAAIELEIKNNNTLSTFSKFCFNVMISKFERKIKMFETRTYLEIERERLGSEPSEDITDDIIKKIESQFQIFAKTFCMELKSFITTIFAVKSNITFAKLSMYRMLATLRTEDLLLESEMKDDWLEIKQHIVHTVETLRIRHTEKEKEKITTWNRLQPKLPRPPITGSDFWIDADLFEPYHQDYTRPDVRPPLKSITKISHSPTDISSTSHSFKLDRDLFILQIEQCINDCLEEEAILCKDMIQQELSEYVLKQTIREPETNELKSKINIQKIKKNIEMEFKNLYIRLYKAFKLEMINDYMRGRLDELSFSKAIDSICYHERKLADFEDTIYPEIYRTGYHRITDIIINKINRQPSEDITDVIISKITIQVQEVTDRFCEEVTSLIENIKEGKGGVMLKEEDKVPHTQSSTKRNTFSMNKLRNVNLRLQLEIREVLFEIQYQIVQTVQELKFLHPIQRRRFKPQHHGDSSGASSSQN